jgi:hypothetical protein
MMWKRATGMSSRLWLAGVTALSVLVVSESGRASFEFISLTTLLPVVFFVTGWNNSVERKGILTIISRSSTSKMVELSEWLFPALTAIALSSVLVFAVSTPPPWQYWVVAPLTAVSFSLVYLIVEQHQRYAGRSILSIVWFIQLAEPYHTGRLLDLVLFTDYPAAVLLADPAAGTHHPDSFVLASLILVIVVTGVYTFFCRRNN